MIINEQDPLSQQALVPSPWIPSARSPTRLVNTSGTPCHLPYRLWQKRLITWLSVCRLVGLVVGKPQSQPWIASDELWSLIEPLLPEPPSKLVEGTAAGTGPVGILRDPVRAAHRYAVGAPDPGVGLRLEHDLLTTAGCLEEWRSAAAGGRSGRQHRLQPDPLFVRHIAMGRPENASRR